MKQNKEILIDSDIKVSLNQQYNPRLFLNYCITMILGVLGCLISMQKALSIPFTLTWFVFCLIFCCGITYLYTLKKKGFLFLGISLLIFIMVMYLMADILKDSFTIVNANLLTAYNKYYHYNVNFYNPTFSEIELKFLTSFFMIASSYLLSLIFGLIVVKAKFPIFYGAFLGAFAYLAMNFTKSPPIFPLILLFISFMLALFMSYATINKKGKIKLGDFTKKNNNKSIYNLSNRNFKNNNLLSGSITIVCVVLVSCIVANAIYPEKKYVPNKKRKENVIEKINSVKSINDIHSIFAKKTVAYGGVGNGELGTVDKIKFKNKVMLKIQTENEAPMYLKSFVGSIYENNSWHDVGHDFINYSKELFDNYYALNDDDISVQTCTLPFQRYIKENSDNLIIENKMIIQNMTDNKVSLIVPYHLTEAPYLYDEINRYDDRKVFCKKSIDKPYEVKSHLYAISEHRNVKEYSPFIENNGMYVINESKGSIDYVNKNVESSRIVSWYDKYVYNNYTKLPDRSNSDMENLISSFETFWENEYYSLFSDGVTIQSFRNDPSRAVGKVKTYLEKNTEYSLSPGKTPANKDFVDYFLYQNREGYCVHYATAATLMLRAGGIPTRYVEGYVVTEQDYEQAHLANSKTVQIRDTNAHAWIEVFDPSIGWVPYEVTPGYNEKEIPKQILTNSRTKDKETEMDLSNEVVNADNVLNQPSSSSEKTESEKQNTSSELKDNTSSQSLTSSAETQPEEERNYYLISFRLIFSLIFILILFIILRRIIVIAKRKKDMKDKNINKAVMSTYKNILSLFKYCGFNLKHHENLDSFTYMVEKKCRYIYSSKLEDIDGTSIGEERLKKLMFLEIQRVKQKGYIEENSNLIKKGEFKEVTAIVQKATFSQHPLSDEEKKKVIAFYERLQNIIYNNMNFLKKIKFKWIRCHK